MTIAIVTDNSAIQPISRFAGLERVRILSMPVQEGVLSAPRLEDFAKIYTELEKTCRGILVLCSAAAFSAEVENARLAALSHARQVPIQVVDTNNIGAGLGALVQVAAQEIANGATLIEAERAVRVAMPHIFHIICAPDAQALSRHGLMHPAQAAAFKHLAVFPTFSVEEGRLVPYAKIRTRRHILEAFLEFMEEFDEPHSITLARGPENTLRAKPLREAVASQFPNTPFSELEMSTPLVTLFSPLAASLTILDRRT